MKTTFAPTAALFLMASVRQAAALQHAKISPVNGDIIDGEYIIMLHPNSTLSSPLADILGMNALDKVEHLYDNFEGFNFKGFSVKDCDTKLAAQIANLKDVALIEHAQIFTTNEVQANPVWGLDRIDQESPILDSLYYYKDTAGAGVDMYTIDTGIRFTHEDFGGRAQSAFTAWDDDGGDVQGHGTHVSSTMAGIAYGVAKQANLYSVKVLGDTGMGTTGQVIAGVIFVNTRSSSRTKIANMSLGGRRSRILNAAVDAATDTLYVVASGNSNGNACNESPASASNTFAVNAMDQGDTRSSFSNFGECTQMFAPGANIQAAWSSSDTATNAISGTSMAAPHVAGIAALLLSESASMSVHQLKDVMTSLATPDMISNVGTGSPNLLAYNDRDAPPPPTMAPTPSPPTTSPTPSPPTMAPTPSPPTMAPTYPPNSATPEGGYRTQSYGDNPIGDNNDSYKFDDYILPNLLWGVSAVKVWPGRVTPSSERVIIEGMCVTYEKSGSNFMRSERCYGKHIQNFGRPVEFLVDVDGEEFINRVEVRAGKRNVEAIQFHTNIGRSSGLVGGPGGDYFDVVLDGQLYAFFGRHMAASEIFKIGFTVGPSAPSTIAPPTVA
jgi:subtilisin family serine protease